MVVIVPTSSEDEFRQNYVTISDYVVPGSAKKLRVPEKDGLTLWYFSH
jgi:hypothetical protein